MVTDHPRACGANTMRYPTLMGSSGSSPRMRGKRDSRRKTVSIYRIIPAHAGQTVFLTSLVSDATDHPRACGANLEFAVLGNKTIGSSPRMRGKPMRLSDADAERRIIPAHAGQTRHVFAWWCRQSDHPRACGANCFLYGVGQEQYGSSPRMRGKPKSKADGNKGIRIIPAHAGQTGALSTLRVVRPDHPRACGANPLMP